MNDIIIDVPPAYSVLERIVEKCVKEGKFLPEKVRLERFMFTRKESPLSTRSTPTWDRSSRGEMNDACLSGRHYDAFEGTEALRI